MAPLWGNYFLNGFPQSMHVLAQRLDTLRSEVNARRSHLGTPGQVAPHVNSAHHGTASLRPDGAEVILASTDEVAAGVLLSPLVPDVSERAVASFLPAPKEQLLRHDGNHRAQAMLGVEWGATRVPSESTPARSWALMRQSSSPSARRASPSFGVFSSEGPQATIDFGKEALLRRTAAGMALATLQCTGTSDSADLAAVERDGQALQYSCRSARNTFSIFRAAVQQDGPALVYASNEMNAVIVLAAVEQMMRAGFSSRAQIIVREHAPSLMADAGIMAALRQ